MSLQVVFLIILGVVSLVYLSTLLFKPTVFQFVLKSCLIPLIFAVYITGTEKYILPVILALFFAWAGDVLLIKIENLLCFRLGLVSFLLGHVCYIIAMSGFITSYNIPVFIISAVIAAILAFFLFKLVKPTPEMKIPTIAYEVIILTMALFAVQLFLSHYKAEFSAHVFGFGLLVLIGSINFVASDTSLALVTFKHKPYYVFCMATYILAQLLITLGFCKAVPLN